MKDYTQGVKDVLTLVENYEASTTQYGESEPPARTLNALSDKIRRTFHLEPNYTEGGTFDYYGFMSILNKLGTEALYNGDKVTRYEVSTASNMLPQQLKLLGLELAEEEKVRHWKHTIIDRTAVTCRFELLITWRDDA